MKSTAVPFLIATTIFSSACSLPVAVEADCAWAKPIRFADATKAWLQAHMPWPDHVRADLDKIAKHNEKHAVFCE
jgi:hypothetical protein